MYTDRDQWADIRRRVLIDGEGKRSVQRRYKIHGKTLPKILNQPEPPGYRESQPRAKKKLGPFLPAIEEILRQDQQAPPQQRHTAKRMFERLRDEHGYAGGLSVVTEAVQAYRQQPAEAFVPLAHQPGEAQVDFGHAEIIGAGVPTKIALFVMTLPYSDALFCCAFPRECTEAFLEGHRRAFDFFGGVPRRISYDNSKIAIAKITGGRAREVTRQFPRLRGHYLFAAHFCLVRRVNEKGPVENLVGYARRNFLVAVPAVPNFEALNTDLLAKCREDLLRRVRGKPTGKADLLAEEAVVLLPLPKQAFEAQRVETARAHSLSLVRCDGNDYAVPTASGCCGSRTPTTRLTRWPSRPGSGRGWRRRWSRPWRRGWRRWPTRRPGMPASRRPASRGRGACAAPRGGAAGQPDRARGLARVGHPQ